MKRSAGLRPVPGATVIGSFTAVDVPVDSCVTDAKGVCPLDNGGGVRKNVSSVQFAVENLTGPLPYTPTVTTVTVFKP